MIWRQRKVFEKTKISSYREEHNLEKEILRSCPIAPALPGPPPVPPYLFLLYGVCCFLLLHILPSKNTTLKINIVL